jgi:hypothetical protein
LVTVQNSKNRFTFKAPEYKTDMKFHTPFISARKSQVFSKNLLLIIVCFALFSIGNPSFGQKKKAAAKPSREYIALRVYHAAAADQLQNIEQYLQASLLPSLEKGGFRKIGVFAAIDNDTASDKRLYVLVPFNSIAQLDQLTAITDKSVAQLRVGHRSATPQQGGYV